MRDDDTVCASLGELDALKRLSQGADLIDLHQHRVPDTFLDATAQAVHVGDEQIITHQLYSIMQALSQQCPAGPVVLGETIFDRYDGIAVYPARIQLHHGLCRLPAAVTL